MRVRSHLRLVTPQLRTATRRIFSYTARNMSTFTLHEGGNLGVTVSLPRDLTREQLLSFPAFKTWFSTLQHSLSLQTRNKSHAFNSSPYSLHEIDVQAVDYFGGDRLGFIKLKALVQNDKGEKLPGSVLLRGGSVAMMLVLQPDDTPPGSEIDKHVILALQPRIPAGSLSFAELPAGMLDSSGTFAGAAAKEISEETGLEIDASKLLDMTMLALDMFTLNGMKEGEGTEELHRGIYPSPGGCDESISLFLWQKRLPRKELDGWRGKLTGLRDEGEKITLTIVRLEDLWKAGARDGKTLAAWALYEGLKREGKL